ncbi:MAG: GntR family transcriptional regulator [Vicinamibacteraceae bacterium]
MRQIKRAPSVRNQTIERIRSAILCGDLCPSTRIRQEELATRLAVSRAPVREALILLEREASSARTAGLARSSPPSTPR